MPAKSDWSGVSLDDLYDNEKLQNLQPEERTKVYDDYADFHELSKTQRQRFQTLQKMDYSVFQSAGLPQERAKAEANQYRWAISESQKAEAAGAPKESFAQIKAAYVDRLMKVGEVYDSATAKRGGALKAAGMLNRIRQIPEIGQDTPEGQELRDQAGAFEATIRNSGADPSIESEELRTLVADNKIITDFKGPSVAQTSNGQWVPSPFHMLRDPEGTKKAITDNVPRIEAKRLLDSFDDVRGEVGKSFRSSLSDKDLLDAGISKIGAENAVLEKRGLKSRSEAARKGISDEVENDIAAEIVTRYIATEEGKSDWTRFADANVDSISSGFERIGRLPFAVDAIFGFEGASRKLEGQIADEQLSGAKSQLRPELSGATEKTAAVTGELFPLGLTLLAGSQGAKVGKLLNFSKTNISRMAQSAAAGFGGARSAAGIAEELTLLQKNGGDIRRAAALAFGMTTLSTLVFNRAGIGGVEQFRAAKDSLLPLVTKSLRQKFLAAGGTLGKGAIEEHGLCVKTKKGWVVITGCAHPGADNMAAQARQVTGGPVHLVAGGFHMMRLPEAGINAVVDRFEELGVQRAAPCHCSGDETRRIFNQRLGNRCTLVGVGDDFRFRPPLANT